MQYFNDMLNALTNANDVMELPYPYASSTRCLPPETYGKLKKLRPAWDVIAGKTKNENNKRVDLNGRTALKTEKIPPIWKDFIEYHTSDSFYKQILVRFGKYLKQYYPSINFDNAKIALRGSGEPADLYLDCMISINTPVSEKCSVSPPHLDHPKEIWAALLYMRDEDDFAGGDFIIDKCVKVPKEYGKRQIEKDCVVRHNIIPYAPNTMVAFINSPLSVHEVTERDATDKPRLMVNFVLEMA